MPWEEDLSDLFGGYINQQPLEEAVGMMLFVSEDHPDYHQRFLQAINGGIEAALHGDTTVIGLVNQSGYLVTTTEKALELLRELRQLYLDRFQAVRTKKEQEG